MRILFCLLLLAISGCASMLIEDNKLIKSQDESLLEEMTQLTNDYLNGQLRGESLDEVMKYGTGAGAFFSMKEFRCYDTLIFLGNPAFKCRVLASNRLGAEYWTDYIISFDLMAPPTSQYKGIRIKHVTEYGR